MRHLTTFLQAHNVSSDTLALVFSDHDADIYALTVSSSQALPLWSQLTVLAPISGFSPLLIGHPRRVEDFRLLRRHQHSAWKAIVDEALQYNPIVELLAAENQQRAMLRTAFRDFGVERERPDLTTYPSDIELVHYLDDYYLTLACEVGEDPATYQPSDPWSDARVLQVSATPVFATEDPTLMLLVPTPHSWHVPAYLYLPDGADSSAPIVCMLRRWYELYGVKLIGAQSSSLELTLTHRLPNREQARRLAWELAIIAPEPDVIYDIEKNAAQMFHGQPFWSLWWD